MSAYRMGIVGFAILGVYMVITAITQIPVVATVWGSWAPWEETQSGRVQLGIAIGATLKVLFYLFAGYFISRNRHRLSAWAVGTDQENESAVPGADLLPMAYSVLGIYLVVVYGSGLVANVPYVFVRSGIPGGGTLELIAQAGPVLVGLLLFFRSQWLAGLWSKGGNVSAATSVSSVASRWSRAGRKPKDDQDES